MIPIEQKRGSFLYGAPFKDHLRPSDIKKIREYELDLASTKVIADCQHWISELEDYGNGGKQIRIAINILKQVTSSLQSRDTPLRGGL